MKRCPTCGWYWLRRPRWFQPWLWPAYVTRCTFLDFFDDGHPSAQRLRLEVEAELEERC